MKKVIDIIRTQCDQCGLVGDRKVYTDGTTQTTCPHCGKQTASTRIR